MMWIDEDMSCPDKAKGRTNDERLRERLEAGANGGCSNERISSGGCCCATGSPAQESDGLALRCQEPRRDDAVQNRPPKN